MRDMAWNMITFENHEQYIKLLERLEPKTHAILLVQIDGYDPDDEVVAFANQCMKLIDKKIVDEWFGTRAPGREAVQYTYEVVPEFFEYLKGYDSFFFTRRTEWGGSYAEGTAFGIDDIAFLDVANNMLFHTTTHEGYAILHEGLL